MRIAQFATMLFGVALTACSQGGALDISKEVQGLPSFSEAPTLYVPILRDQPDAGGDCLTAQLVKSGSLTFSPLVSGEPYWTAASATGGGQNGGFSVAVGDRKVTGVTDRRSWKENSVQYSAATVTYEIESNGNLAPRGEKFGPMTLRLVFENDPAVGSWVLSNQSPQLLNHDEEALAVKFSLVEAQGCDITLITSAIDVAKEAAFDQIERSIATEHGIRRTKTSNIVENAKAGRAVYVSLQDEPSLALPVTQIVSRAKELCGSLTAGGHSDWTIGSYADIRSMTTSGARAAMRMPIDTPDRRIWGPFLSTINAPTRLSLPVSDASAQTWGPISVLNVGLAEYFGESDLAGFQQSGLSYRLFCSRSL